MSNVAIVQEGFIREDPWSTLKVVTLPIPKAAAGEVVVHISMRNIHIYDFIVLSNGVRNGTPRGEDFIIVSNGVSNGTLGVEGFGIVHEVGEGVTKFQKGQRVRPHTSAGAWAGNGSWQHYIRLAAELGWPVPDAMSDEQATQFVINPWTSYSVLKQLQPVPPGEYVVQTAAGSTVGMQLSSLAKHWGIQMINIVRRPEQKAELLALGDHQVICSSEEDVVARVKAITSGHGAWAALDAVSGTMTQTLGSCVRDGGRIIVYGYLGGNASSVNAMDLLRGVSVTGFNVKSVIQEFESREACAAEVAPLVIDGILPVPCDVEKFELMDFKRALVRAKEPGHSSKVLLVN